MENQIFELQYAMDTFYFLICGALVMWMAAGFSMLEAGLVRTKNTTEILTKNVGLFAIACTMYLVCGYQFMYDGGYFLSGVTTVAQMDDAAVAQVLSDSASEGFDGGSVYSEHLISFSSGVCCYCNVYCIWAVAERMKLWAFLAFAVVMTGFIYPIEGGWMVERCPRPGSFATGYAGSASSSAGAAAALAGVIILGPRKGKTVLRTVNAIPGANLPIATLGVFILWMGWFGFNGGST